MKWDNKEEIVRKTIWTCGCWRLTLEKEKFFITNMKLSLSPCGIGKTEKEAAISLLKDIEIYKKNLNEAEKEVREHLEILGGENE